MYWKSLFHCLYHITASVTLTSCQRELISSLVPVNLQGACSVIQQKTICILGQMMLCSVECLQHCSVS